MARGLAREPGEIRVDEVGERRLLDVGGHAHDDARCRHLMQIEKDAARGRDDDDGDQHPRQRAAVGLHQRVEGVLDDERIAAGCGCQARGEGESQGDLAPARPDPVGDEAPQRALRPRIELER